MLEEMLYATYLLNVHSSITWVGREICARLLLIEYKGYKITNFEMESSALAGLSRLMGHKAMTVCMVIANRLIKEANTGYKNTIDTLIKTVLDRI